MQLLERPGDVAGIQGAAWECHGHIIRISWGCYGNTLVMLWEYFGKYSRRIANTAGIRWE